MLSGVTTWNVGIEPKERVLQIIIGAQINLEVDEGGQDGDDNQGRGNKEHGGRNDEQGGGNDEWGSASHDKEKKMGEKGGERNLPQRKAKKYKEYLKRDKPKRKDSSSKT